MSPFPIHVIGVCSTATFAVEVAPGSAGSIGVLDVLAAVRADLGSAADFVPGGGWRVRGCAPGSSEAVLSSDSLAMLTWRSVAHDYCALLVDTLEDSPSLTSAGTRPAPGAVYVETGPDSGFCAEVGSASFAVSRHAAVPGALTLRVADPFLSRSGTRVDRAVVADDPVWGRIASTTMRPARAVSPTGIGALPLIRTRPEVDEVNRARMPPWWVHLAPLGLGLVLVLVTGRWWFLLFGLSGPLAALATWLVDRRREKQETAEAIAHYARDFAAHIAALEEDRRAVLDRSRDTTHVPPVFRIGTGLVDLPAGWRAAPGDTQRRSRSNARRTPPALVRAVDLIDSHRRPECHEIDGNRYAIAPEGPVLCDLDSALLLVRGVEEVCRDVVRGFVARSLAAGDQVCLHGVVPSPALPGDTDQEHTDVRSESGRITEAPAPGPFPEFLGTPVDFHSALGCHRDPARASTHREFTDRSAAGYLVVELPDESCVASAREYRIDRIGAGARNPEKETWGLTCRADSTAILEIPPGIAPQRLPVPRAGPFRLARLQADKFLLTCTSWTRTRDPWTFDSTAAELIGTTRREPIRWSGAPTLACPIGQGEDGAMILDLDADGPHALVAGTTGSGKSVLLRTWVAHLAMLNPPERLRFVLIDFKGGATFRPFRDLPHVDAVTDDLAVADGARTLRALSAEVHRRELVLQRAGVSDVAELDDVDGLPVLPRLLVVIDEFQAFVSAVPDGVEKLEALTALGRSLGIHVVLTTQRPAGVITPRMKANIDLRIALRVRDEADSREILDVPDAARLDAGIKGLAVVSRARALTRFRVAPVPVRASDSTSAAGFRLTPLTSLSCSWTPESSRRVPVIPHGAEPELDLETLVDHCRRLRPTVSGGSVPPPLSAHPFVPGATALLDLPEHGGVRAWTYEPRRDGSLLLVGGSHDMARDGISAVLGALLATDLPVILLARDPEVVLSRLRGVGDEVDGAASVFAVAHDQAWLVEFVLGELESGSLGAVHVCVEGWDEFVRTHDRSRRIDRLEHVLRSGSEVTFSLSVDRRILQSGLGSRADTRIFFPPSSAQDAVFLGFGPTRFAHVQGSGRVVVLGPACAEAGPEGADALLALPDDSGPDAVPESGTQPARGGSLFGDRARREPSPTENIMTGDEFFLGVDPFGRSVMWSVREHGHVLTVWSPSIVLDGFLDRVRDACEYRGDEVLVLDERTAPDARAVAEATAHPRVVVGRVLGGGTSPIAPVSRLERLGPVLVLDARTPHDLAEIGYRDLPVLPRSDSSTEAPEPGLAKSWKWGWFRADRPVPIRMDEHDRDRRHSSTAPGSR